MGKRFQKKEEDFFCENCKKKVKGDGYTDHCPNCLFSKHVDINPGDRKSLCGGIMKPIGVKRKGDGYIIYYKCLKCNEEKRVKAKKDDNLEEIIKIAKNPVFYGKEKRVKRKS